MFPFDMHAVHGICLNDVKLVCVTLTCMHYIKCMHLVDLHVAGLQLCTGCCV